MNKSYFQPAFERKLKKQLFEEIPEMTEEIYIKARDKFFEDTKKSIAKTAIEYFRKLRE